MMPEHPATLEVFARSVDRRWRSMLRDISGGVLVFSPYLSYPTANSIIQLKKPHECDVYTVLSLDNFVAGASSIRSFQELLELGYRLHHIDSLHAKLVIIPGKAATIGSQNLTVGGIRNREVSVMIKDSSHIEDLCGSVQKWVTASRRIDLEEVLAFKQRLAPLKKKLRAIRSEMRIVDDELQSLRQLRLENERQCQNAIQSAYSTLNEIDGNGNVTYSQAHRFIRSSAWWLTCRWGPRRAPKHADRISAESGDWQVRFGRNEFLVGKAIRRCVAKSKDFLSLITEKPHSSKTELFSSLQQAVAGAVAWSGGAEYSGFYPIVDSKLCFGAQAIDVNDFVFHFLHESGMNTLFYELSRLGKPLGQ